MPCCQTQKGFLFFFSNTFPPLALSSCDDGKLMNANKKTSRHLAISGACSAHRQHELSSPPSTGSTARPSAGVADEGGAKSSDISGLALQGLAYWQSFITRLLISSPLFAFVSLSHTHTHTHTHTHGRVPHTQTMQHVHTHAISCITIQKCKQRNTKLKHLHVRSGKKHTISQTQETSHRWQQQQQSIF